MSPPRGVRHSPMPRSQAHSSISARDGCALRYVTSQQRSATMRPACYACVPGTSSCTGFWAGPPGCCGSGSDRARTEHVVIDILCVSGASGFIGRHFLRTLEGRSVATVRYLSRNGDIPGRRGARDEVVDGDMRDEIALERWLAAGSIVVNLAFDRTASSAENVASAAAL